MSPNTEAKPKQTKKELHDLKDNVRRCRKFQTQENEKGIKTLRRGAHISENIYKARGI